ncbi:hypothetical protein OPQ81_004413 [Rhizoctonia solani]|nr:hypothetical protein OPQ81_004413 [Rhizoctonia solani]
MKSLVALLDRKKKDRANTLVQVPFPSTLPHSAVHRDGETSIHGARRTSTPSSFLRPSQQHRAASDSGHTYHPLLSEPSPYYRGHSPPQSASYFTDSDDGTFIDPFAPSPTKLNLTSKPHHDASHQICSRRGSEPNTASTGLPSSYRFRPSQELNGALVVDEPQSQRGVTASTGKKGRWLRERRSLTSLLRPQQPNNSAKPVPTVPPMPGRVPERKTSLFFNRARSGSASLATQATEPAHTAHQPPLALEPVELPIPTSHQPRTVYTESKNGSSCRGSVPVPSQANSPDSWVRVGGMSGDPGFLVSPITRRRAISVPLPLPQPTEPPPPVPGVQPQYEQKPKDYCFSATSPEAMLMRRPGTSAECRKPAIHHIREVKSAFVSLSAPERSNASTHHKEQEQSAPRHIKQSSMGTVESLVLKSALKHRPAEPAQSRSALPVQSVKPLRICKREGISSKMDPPQFPTPPSDISLKSLHHTSIDHMDGTRATTQHHQSTSGPPSGRKSLGEVPVNPQGVLTMDESASSSATAGSFGSIMKGYGLSSCDSRSLPVLDNIWGSFVSETAFGSSLPPSPVASISARYRTMRSQETSVRGQIGHSSPDLKNPRRKRSRSSANATALLTPPISPVEEVVLQGLDRAITTSTSDDKPSSRPIKNPSIPCQQLGPRLARSASSPSIRPPASPGIGYSPINSRSSVGAPRFSVQDQNTRSIPRLLVSQSSSQCITVPGTPAAVSRSALNLITSYPGTSNGLLAASGLGVCTPREGSGYAESQGSSVIGVSTQVPGPGSGGTPQDIQNRFPRAHSSRIWAHEEGKTIDVMRNQDAAEGDLGDEPLLTPPVTPAWVVHVFDVDTEDNLHFDGVEHDASSDHIPLARSGNLAQMRRQKHGDMRSISTEFPAEHSHRPDMSRPDPGKSDVRSNKALKNANSLTRNVL